MTGERKFSRLRRKNWEFESGEAEKGEIFEQEKISRVIIRFFLSIFRSLLGTQGSGWTRCDYDVQTEKRSYNTKVYSYVQAYLIV